MRKDGVKMKLWIKNTILLLILAAIIAVPMIFSKDAEFGGADGNADQFFHSWSSSWWID